MGGPAGHTFADAPHNASEFWIFIRRTTSPAPTSVTGAHTSRKTDVLRHEELAILRSIEWEESLRR